jgi:hypothetical protein
VESSKPDHAIKPEASVLNLKLAIAGELHFHATRPLSSAAW